MAARRANPMKPTPKKPGAKKRAKPAAASSKGVRIRMYNVGFGDCFLLFVPAPDGRERKILIDCGSIKSGKRPFDEIVDAVFKDIGEPNDTPHIDLLIATHRHKDHITGFQDARWSKVTVGEVWMPWTENESDTEARRLRMAHERFVFALQRSVNRRKAHLPRYAALKEILLNARSNDKALQTLHRGFSGNPRRRYLPVRPELPGEIKTDVVPGVTFHVFGPPFDERVLNDMDPKEGESFFAALEFDTGDVAPEDVTFSFGYNWAIQDDIASDHLGKDQRLSPRDMKAVQTHATSRDWELLAAKADQAINNTSLILFMQIGNAGLFFPGDAQWGPWKFILADPHVQRLLGGTTFYKVSHHASHNATPPGFVELLAEHRKGRAKRWAMVSVAKHGSFDDVPREPLIEAVRKVAPNLVRSDQSSGPEGVTREGDLWVEITVPTG